MKNTFFSISFAPRLDIVPLLQQKMNQHLFFRVVFVDGFFTNTLPNFNSAHILMTWWISRHHYGAQNINGGDKFWYAETLVVRHLQALKMFRKPSYQFYYLHICLLIWHVFYIECSFWHYSLHLPVGDKLDTGLWPVEAVCLSLHPFMFLSSISFYC